MNSDDAWDVYTNGEAPTIIEKEFVFKDGYDFGYEAGWNASEARYVSARKYVEESNKLIDSLKRDIRILERENSELVEDAMNRTGEQQYGW